MIRIEKMIWVLVAAVAVSAAIIFRFTGLGTWPLADDEFFVFRSMQFIIQSGLPEFPCGGFYNRGLLYQAITVPLLQLGVTPEMALRSVAVLANLLMLPAAFLLARKIAGLRFAVSVLVILCLSAWEIEMARFGRMYAPFQAVFLWYAYHACHLVADLDLKRWRWLIGLSAVGMFVWEGAIVLVLCNFLPMFLGLRFWQKKHLASALTMLAAALSYMAINFRYIGSAPFINSSEVPNADVAGREISAWFLQFMPGLPTTLAAGIVFTVFAITLIVLGYFAIKQDKLTVQELLVIAALFVTVIAGQVLLSVFVVVAGVLVGWVGLQSLQKPGLRRFAIAAGLTTTAVIGIAVLGDAAPTLTARLSRLIAFPDVLYMFAYPWLDTIPVMLGVVVLALSASFIVLLLKPERLPAHYRLLFLISLTSIFVITAAPTLYRETRYSFFLYPLLISMCGYLIHAFNSGKKKTEGRWQHTALPVAMIAAFMISKDFDFRHLMAIDSYDANFRVGYSDIKRRHYYTRTDYAAAAEYVNKNAVEEDTVIVTAVAVTPYLVNADYVFMSRTDPRARGQVCPDQGSERWTGIPWLGSVDELERVAADAGGHNVFVVVDQHLAALGEWQQYVQRNSQVEVVLVTPDGRLQVYRIQIKADS